MNGTLIINKPADWTSHDVVAKLRGILGTRRIGHTGTLDPFATGVLVVCVGAATRLVQFLVGLDKEYLATVRLGFATDTQDYTGKPISPLPQSNAQRASVTTAVTAAEIRRVVAEFAGEQQQLPPMYSAKKVGGETLHKAARAGRVIERQPVAINVYAIEMLDDLEAEDELPVSEDGTGQFRLRVRCSSGAYIRTLAHDIGERLGVGGHLAALHRTAVGQFSIDRALTLAEVERRRADETLSAAVVSLADSLSHLRRLTLDAREAQDVLHGRAIVAALDTNERQAGESESEDTGWMAAGKSPAPVVRLCDARGELLALGEPDAAQGVIKPRVVFHPQKA